MAQIFTHEEIGKHNEEGNLWMVIHGSVYDLTKFLKEHPGGEEVLLQLAGQDGTQCFDDIGHSGEAITLRESFKIGEVQGGSRPSGQSPSVSGAQETSVDDDNWEYQPIKEKSSPWLPVMIASGIVVYGVIFYYFFHS